MVAQKGPFAGAEISYVDIAPIIGYAVPCTMDTPGAGTVRGRVNVTLIALLAPFSMGPATFDSWLGRQGGCAYACVEVRVFEVGACG